MIPLHLARIRGAWQIHHFGVRYYLFRSTRTEEKKPRNGDHSCSSDGEKEEENMGVESDAAIRTTH